MHVSAAGCEIPLIGEAHVWVLAGGTSFQYKKGSDQGGTRLVPLCLFHPCHPEDILCVLESRVR